MSDFKLKSNSFEDGDYLAIDYALPEDPASENEGGNKSPHLVWNDPPEGTKSFALTMFDPDAPTGSGFWHWLVVNIPPDVRELVLDTGNHDGTKLPAGAMQTRTDFGVPGYGGPRPPVGDHPHRYIFAIHAVPLTELPVSEDTSAAIIGFQLNYNTLAKSTLMALYKR